MKLRILAFAVMMLASIIAIASISAIPVSGFQSPLEQPAFISPINAPAPTYIGKELVLTQEAQYVNQVAATHSALATLAWTPTYTLSLTPSPVSSLPPIATTTPTPNQ